MGSPSIFFFGVICETQIVCTSHFAEIPGPELEADMSSDAYTPGGVSSVLSASSSGKRGKKHRAENKAVLDLFSKKIPKYDYSVQKDADSSGDGSPTVWLLG